MYMESAKSIWDDLCTRFSHTNIPKLFNLRKEISYLSQGNLSISAYFTKFRALNDELEALSEMPKCTCNHCTCAVNDKLSTYLKSIMLAQFLMGLNDQYTVIRGHILMIAPPPSLSEAYGILLQEEHQREKNNTSSLVPDNAALVVKQYNEYGNKNSRNTKRINTDTANLFYDICQMQGHNRDKCFCLHGYPDWHKLYGKFKPKSRNQSGKGSSQANHVAGSSTTVSDSLKKDTQSVTSDSKFSAPLSESQCQQIMQLIQADFKEFNTSSTGNWHNASINYVHAAGPCPEEDYRDW